MSNSTTPMSIANAEHAWHVHKPWRILLVFRGRNENNISGKSNKWWTAYGDGGNRAFINFGKAGSTGRSSHMEVAAYEAIQKAYTKVSEGYLVDAPVQSASIPVKSPPKNSVPQKILDLPAPFCDIRRLRRQSTKFFALDGAENVIAEITSESFRSLIYMGDMTLINTSYDITEWRI